MRIIQNYSKWLLTESGLTLPDEPTTTEDSASYVESKLNDGTGQTFSVVSLEGDESGDLYAIFADDEQKAKYEETQDPEVAEFIIFKPTEDDLGFGDSELEDPMMDGPSGGSTEEFGFTYLVEDDEMTEHEENEETFDSLDACIDALVQFINSESETEGDDEFGIDNMGSEPEMTTSSEFDDESSMQSELDSLKKQAQEKKSEYLSKEKGSPERDELSQEMIALNKQIMELEKKLNKKLTAHTSLDDDDDLGGSSDDMFESRKNVKIKSYSDWSKQK